MQSNGKTYSIKSIFGPTIQGEGSMTGTPCHFIRFAGCNMWDGRPETKAESKCPYCDTDFFGGEKLTAEGILRQVNALGQVDWITLSGGEPALQFDGALSRVLKGDGYRLAIETNGTHQICGMVDHVTMSPKVPYDKLKFHWADDLKLLFPHPTLKPEDFVQIRATNFYLQPIEDDNLKENTRLAVEYCLMSKGRWKLSVQIHKLIGLP